MNIKIKSTVTMTLALTLALGLTACGSEAQRQEVPSSENSVSTDTAEGAGGALATEAPEEEAPAASVVEAPVIPEDVQAQYGENTATLVAEAERLVNLTQSQAGDFYGPREGDEAIYYRVIDREVTPEAWEKINAFVASGTEEDSDRLASLIPQTERSGSYGVYDGVEYTAIPEGGITVTPVSTPVISIASHEDGSTRGVSYSVDLEYFVAAEPADLVYASNLTLILVPDVDGQWVIDGWQAAPYQSVAVVN